MNFRVGPVLPVRMAVLAKHFAQRFGAAVVQQGITLADAQQRRWIEAILPTLVLKAHFLGAR
jgi:hypothetical protein